MLMFVEINIAFCNVQIYVLFLPLSLSDSVCHLVQTADILLVIVSLSSVVILTALAPGLRFLVVSVQLSYTLRYDKRNVYLDIKQRPICCLCVITDIKLNEGGGPVLGGRLIGWRYSKKIYEYTRFSDRSKCEQERYSFIFPGSTGGQSFIHLSFCLHHIISSTYNYNSILI